MRLTQPLCLPPVFRFWKDFGAGRQRRMPHFKHWRHVWRRIIARKEIPDHTLKPEQLPPGSIIMDAEDFMTGPIDAMPAEILKMKEEQIVYDHPWPFNVKLDAIRHQKPIRKYTMYTRFFVPAEDSQALSNTLLEPEALEAKPLVEPNDEQYETAMRHYTWSTKGDSVLVRQPAAFEFPFINRRPMAKYGVTKERKEFNVMSSLHSLTQTILASHLKEQGKHDALDLLMNQRSLAFPRCQALYERQNVEMSLHLTIDNLSIGNAPLPLINTNPESTREREPIDLHPRSWKSLLEPTNMYSTNWTFSLPKNVHLNTIMLASRIKRQHRENEMMARAMIHSFGLTSQFARLRAYESQMSRVSGESSQASAVLLDPLTVPGVNDKDLLEQPIVLQTIGLDLDSNQFHFMRYQLNTLKFDDTIKDRIKNQAWYSGPISDLRDVLRFYLDFLTFDSLAASSGRQIENAKRIRHTETAKQGAQAA